MFYKKYQLYDDGLEIMIPSNLNLTDTFLSSQYSWISDDRKIVINITRGSSSFSEDNLKFRINEYYKRFSKEVSGFECNHISRRKINMQVYGEIKYTSYMMGYPFFNIFLLGNYEDRELVITIQCIQDVIQENTCVFENISDSIRLLKKKGED